MSQCFRQAPIRTLACLSPKSLVFPPVSLTPTCWRAFSVLNRPPPIYDGHVPLTRIERGALAAGSALGAVMNPRRADLVATLGEVTADPFIRHLRDAMLRDVTGRRILRDRPRITSATMPATELRTLPENTVGRVYATWLDDYRMSPDGRDVVRYIDDEECAYVMQRYRECHDIYHAVLGIPAFVEGEIALKAFEFANTRLPMPALSMVAVVRLKPDERSRFFNIYLPWAVKNGLKSQPIINVYWEKEVRTDVDDLLRRLQIEKPPDLRSIRRKERLRKKAEQGTEQKNKSGASIKNESL